VFFASKRADFEQIIGENAEFLAIKVCYPFPQNSTQMHRNKHFNKKLLISEPILWTFHHKKVVTNYL
jgi:hypothetical protein